MNDLDTAARAVASLETLSPVNNADEIASSFEAAGERIAASLEKAASRGELSFGGMVDTILKDFARLAVDDLIAAPLTRLLSELTPLGRGSSQGSTAVNLNIFGTGNAAEFRRSEGQIAATLARAVSLGQQRT